MKASHLLAFLAFALPSTASADEEIDFTSTMNKIAASHLGKTCEGKATAVIGKVTSGLSLDYATDNMVGLILDKYKGMSISHVFYNRSTRFFTMVVKGTTDGKTDRTMYVAVIGVRQSNGLDTLGVAYCDIDI